MAEGGRPFISFTDSLTLQYLIHMQGDDRRNEYFQDYSFFSNGSANSRERNFFFTENSFMVDFKEPLSLGYSDNQSILDDDQSCKVQPTRLATRANEAEENVNSSVVPQQKNQIVFDAAALDSYKSSFQGTKDDTVELNINFKTILVNFLKELILANELNQQQIQNVTQFIATSPSFNSLKTLFKDTPSNKKIRKLCLEIFSSSDCIKRVMNSRCKLKTKLQMVKYIEKVRLNILCPDITIKWKDVLKKTHSDLCE